MTSWRTRWTNDHSLLERMMTWTNPIFERIDMKTAVYAETIEQADKAVKELGLEGNSTMFSARSERRVRGTSFDRIILVGNVQMSDRALRELGPALLRANVFRWRQETL